MRATGADPAARLRGDAALSRSQLIVYGAVAVALLLLGARWIRSADHAGAPAGERQLRVRLRRRRAGAGARRRRPRRRRRARAGRLPAPGRLAGHRRGRARRRADAPRRRSTRSTSPRALGDGQQVVVPGGPAAAARRRGGGGRGAGQPRQRDGRGARHDRGHRPGDGAEHHRLPRRARRPLLGRGARRGQRHRPGDDGRAARRGSSPSDTGGRARDWRLCALAGATLGVGASPLRPRSCRSRCRRRSPRRVALGAMRCGPRRLVRAARGRRMRGARGRRCSEPRASMRSTPARSTASPSGPSPRPGFVTAVPRRSDGERLGPGGEPPTAGC